MSEESKLTVQHAWRRVMLQAPDGPGLNRHVSLQELEEFVRLARAEAYVACGGDRDRYVQWLGNRNVALMDSRLYVDTPWGEKEER